jgi:ABC-type Fe3+-hydroxamate transport system substrate-binding protein
MRAVSMFIPPFLFIMAMAWALYAPGGERKGVVPVSPARVVSLSPSLTRMIVDLGEEQRVAGVTSWDDLAKKGVPVTGNLLHPGMEAIMRLRPDAVVLSLEDGAVQATEKLEATGIPCITFPRSADFEAIAASYMKMAALLGREPLAEKKLAAYRRKLTLSGTAERRPLVALFISHAPLVAASGSSFPGRAVEDAGGRNIFSSLKISYPIVTPEILARRRPDVIIVLHGESVPFMYEALKRFSGIPAIERRAVYVLPPDRVAFYTPADYVAAVREIAELYTKAPAGEKNTVK